MNVICSDIEGDDLLPGVTKIWCASHAELEGMAGPVTRAWTDTKYSSIMEVFADPDAVLVMHNGYSYDKPAIEKVIGQPVKCEIIDTLFLSWNLEPKRQMHGLATWGEEFGVPKPKVDDWAEHDLEVYIHRCEEDVKIQVLVWRRLWKQLMLLYNDEKAALRHARHISFKAKCAAMQARSKWKLDVDACVKLSQEFEVGIEAARKALAVNMPLVPKLAKRNYPKKRYKMDGSLSTIGARWAKLCEEHGVDPDKTESIMEQVGTKEPNPGSHTQMKSWLYSMGWKPETFEYKRDKETGNVTKIPQIKNKDLGELCPSVERLIKVCPAIEHLRNLSIITHRKTITDGFLRDVDSDGYVVAAVQGLTNTIRFKHKTCLNIPSERKPYGYEIRSLLKARSDAYELCGSDMESLEDRTKQHYMWPYDPDYVREMMAPDFDPHTDMALAAKLMTPEDVFYYKANKDNHDDPKVKKLALARHAGKSCNYAATYGAQGPTIARAAGVEESVGTALCDAYWTRNWSLKAIADASIVKQSKGLKWIWNPVAEMWFYLKAEKDRFSTLNQGTGTYCFDRWLYHILKRRPQLTAQFHDEGVWELKKGNRDAMVKILNDAIADVNKELKLNRELGCSVAFGPTYAGVH